MKQLSLNEMEGVQGGILCSEIDDVLYYLGSNDYWGQYWVVVMLKLDGKIQCIPD